ncbi:MAG TPA: serine/threonine-protein kinase [Myxococcaceae bacterium]|nr:serine/threonine-protein kinase [Myxococcaceae bacterium]
MGNATSIQPGTEVGCWRVVSWRGQGSYGVVYLAEPTRQEGGRRVALKLALRPGDERFEREVELLSRLNHPHVPRLLDSGTWTSPQGTSVPFLVMEWVEGVSLYQWAKRHRPNSRQVLELLAQVARALAATHEVEGVHRDVKGDNVLVTSDGRAVLMDFGSAAYRGARVVTQPGTPVGTPEYWSPEAHLFHYRFGRRAATRYAASPADDVYALGVMAYRLVTGEYPPAALVWEPGVDLPQPAKPEGLKPEAAVTVSPELAALIRQMLSEAPPVRGSAVEVAQALEHAEKTAGRKANRRITQRWARIVAKRAERFGSRGSGMEWLGWGLAAALGVMLAVLIWGSEHSALGEPPAQAVRGADEEDAAALGGAALKEPQSAQMPASEQSGLGRDMPTKPFGNQRRPPCAKQEVELHRGCWIRQADTLPPCVNGYFAWQGGCYWPVLIPQPPATSEQP